MRRRRDESKCCRAGRFRAANIEVRARAGPGATRFTSRTFNGPGQDAGAERRSGRRAPGPNSTASPGRPIITTMNPDLPRKVLEPRRRAAGCSTRRTSTGDGARTRRRSPPARRTRPTRSSAAANSPAFQAEKLLHGRWQGLALGPYRILGPARPRRHGHRSISPATPRHVRGTRRRGAGRAEDPPAARRPRAGADADPVPARDRHGQAREPPERRAHAAPAASSTACTTSRWSTSPGKTVQRLVAQGGPLPVGEAARVFADVAAGLAAHPRADLIHRDLKPANVMVTPGRRGRRSSISASRSRPASRCPTTRASSAGKGYILGTMDYIAPEQASDATDVGARSRPLLARLLRCTSH